MFDHVGVITYEDDKASEDEFFEFALDRRCYWEMVGVEVGVVATLLPTQRFYSSGGQKKSGKEQNRIRKHGKPNK